MNELRLPGFEGFGLLVLGLIFGHLITRFFGCVPGKKQSAQERKQNRTENTQRNIAGRIRNAITKSLPENLQWGHLLKITSDQNTVFITYEIGPGATRSVLKCSAHCHDGEGVIVKLLVLADTSISQTMYTSDPNNPTLTELIGDAVDYLRTWKPKQ
jgi:hypothetical protein